MIYEIIAIILIITLSIFVGVMIHKNRVLKKGIKDFNPVVYTNQTNIVQIGKCEIFTQTDENALSINKDLLRLLLKQIDYRIATYTTTQNTCYRQTTQSGDQVIYELKSDSEKWMETGRMNGYIDIRADIEHLIAKESSTK